MFDLLSFGRKNAKSISTSCLVHGARVKLEGSCDDTVLAMAELAAQQVKDVRFSFPKKEVTATHTKAESHTYTPEVAAIAINNGEALETETEKPKKGKRGGIDAEVLNGLNGK